MRSGAGRGDEEVARTRVVRASTRVVALCGAVVLSFGLTACGTEPAADPRTHSPSAIGTDPAASISAGDDEVEVLTWWSTGHWKAGLDALLGVLDAQTAGRVEYVGAPVGMVRDHTLAEHIGAMTDAGRTLDSFQLNGSGGTVRKLVASDDVRALDDVYDELGLAAVWPEHLFDLLATDGHLYGMPAVADRTNLLWSNRHALANAGLDPDATYGSVDEWITAMQQVEAAGGRPLALGTDWTQALLAENVLLAELGPQRHQGKGGLHGHG